MYLDMANCDKHHCQSR